LLAGEPVTAGLGKALDLSSCPQILPTLVTYEEAVGFESVRQYAHQKFFEALDVPDTELARIGPLLILTVEEIEILEGLAKQGYLADEILREYIAYVQENPRNYSGSFRRFTSKRKYPKRSSEQSMVAKIYQRSFQTIGAELEKRFAALSAAEAQQPQSPPDAGDGSG
jgi:hypothetical protein